jgi:hypothetical protein
MSFPPLMLDTGPLAQLVHPRLDPDLAQWFKAAVAAGLNLVVPEIADYELRRKLLHKDLRESLARLDSLEASVTYLAIDTPTLRRAAVPVYRRISWDSSVFERKKKAGCGWSAGCEAHGGAGSRS